MRLVKYRLSENRLSKIIHVHIIGKKLSKIDHQKSIVKDHSRIIEKSTVKNRLSETVLKCTHNFVEVNSREGINELSIIGYFHASAGDPHASERIGPSCSRTQMAITVAQLVAAQSGASCSQINLIQENVLPLVQRYHGRETLLKWMTLQVQETVLKNQEVTPYAEFIKEEIRTNNLDLNHAREHTKVYLESYNSGHARPPLQYYQKVAKKDKVVELFSAEDLAKFESIVAQIF